MNNFKDKNKISFIKNTINVSVQSFDREIKLIASTSYTESGKTIEIIYKNCHVGIIPALKIFYSTDLNNIENTTSFLSNFHKSIFLKSNYKSECKKYIEELFKLGFENESGIYKARLISSLVDKSFENNVDMVNDLESFDKDAWNSERTHKGSIDLLGQMDILLKYDEDVECILYQKNNNGLFIYVIKGPSGFYVTIAAPNSLIPKYLWENFLVEIGYKNKFSLPGFHELGNQFM